MMALGDKEGKNKRISFSRACAYVGNADLCSCESYLP